jgi:23S rRNA pseudouridine1911/1915/1917 synthase
VSGRRTLEHLVTPDEAGERLDRVLARNHQELSRARIQSLIEGGRLIAGGVTITDANYRVKPSERLTLKIPPVRPARPEAQDIPLTIAYEDEHLLVVDKPAGMVVHPAAGNPDGTLVNALIAHCGDSLSGIGGERRPGIVHRIDKDTSGLMVVAKTDEAHIRLSNALAARTLTREYRALVWGVPEPPEGEIRGNIGRSRRNRKKMDVLEEGGKPALTRYRVERAFGRAVSLVSCRLATGRTHQIRVHMTHIGHPLLGDPVYGGRHQARLATLPVELQDRLAGFRRQALHARRIAFHHPVTDVLIDLESPLPADMSALAEALEAAFPAA